VQRHVGGSKEELYIPIQKGSNIRFILADGIKVVVLGRIKLIYK
jgi:hypothetical protein